MKIEINENYYIDFDGNQWTPFYYSESKEMTSGPKKGQMSKAGWSSSNKFFMNRSSALLWIANHELNKSESMTLHEYVNRLESLLESFKVNIEGK